MSLLQNYRVHSIDWSVSVAVRKEFLALDCAGNDVADKRVLLRQICCEVHLLPFELLSNAQSWKTEV